MATTTTTADVIRQAFEYWGQVPALYPACSTDELQRNYENQSGPTHWFDADTLRFFGSRNRHLVRPGVMVETQTKAPEGVGRYTVTAWVIDETAPRDHRTMGRISPHKVGTFHSLREARRFEVEVSDWWVEAMKNTEVAS